MEITKSQKRLFILLGILICYLIYDVIANWETYSKFYSGEKAKPVQAAVKKDSTKIVSEQKEVDYLADWGKDPFYMVITSGPKRNVKRTYTPKLDLYAISYKGDQSAALINDNFLKVGDMVAGYKLKKIEKNQVTLSDGKRTIRLKLVNY